MKRILILALSILMVFSACSKQKTKGEKTPETNKTIQTEEGDITINLQASAKEIKTGEYLDLAVKMNTGHQHVNTSQLFLNFDPEYLEVDHITTAYSEFTIWTKKDTKNGIITLQSAEPNPGLYGSNIEVATVIFKAKKDGNTNITLDKNISKVYSREDLNKLKKSGHKNFKLKIDKKTEEVEEETTENKSTEEAK